MIRRSTAALAAVATLVLGLAGCASARTSGSGPEAVAVPAPVSPAELAGVTLRVGDQKGISQRELLRAAGLLDDIPYRVEWSTFTSGPPMLEAVNAAAIDVGQVGNTPPIFSAAAGGQIRMIGALRSGVGDVLLAPRGSTLTGIAGLRGRTVAVAKGSSANGTLLNALATAGLKPTDVTISYLQPSDASAAFAQGSLAAWMIWEPYATEAVRNQGAREVISGTDALNGTGSAGTPLSNGYSFVVANPAALTDAGKNSALGDFVTRVGRANQWARAHPDQWAGVYSGQTGIARDISGIAAPRLVGNPLPLDEAVVSSEQKLADAFTEAGLLPGRVEVSGFFDRRFNAVVDPPNGGGR